MIDYWDILGALWDVIDIYEGPRVFRQTYNSVPRESGLIFAAHFCQTEVCTGGFEQFFWDPAGVLAPEAVEGFREIGLPQPGYRLKRVLDYIAASLDEDISLSHLAAIAGMSPHYFSELFKQSTGRAPHNYVLLQRIERAKQQLRDPQRSIIDAGLDAGFQNSSHFARMFRKLVGTTPSRYRADNVSRTTY